MRNGCIKHPFWEKRDSVRENRLVKNTKMTSGFVSKCRVEFDDGEASVVACCQTSVAKHILLTESLTLDDFAFHFHSVFTK